MRAKTQTERRQRIKNALRLLHHFVCRHQANEAADCEDCATHMTEAYGIEDRCPYGDLATMYKEKVERERQNDGCS